MTPDERKRGLRAATRDRVTAYYEKERGSSIDFEIRLLWEIIDGLVDEKQLSKAGAKVMKRILLQGEIPRGQIPDAKGFARRPRNWRRKKFFTFVFLRVFRATFSKLET